MKNIRILIVEDDPLLQKSISEHISSYAQTEFASCAYQAKEICLKQEFDVAIIDLFLDGELKGIELVKYVISKGITPIVLSSEESEKITEQAYLAGCQHFYSKKNLKASLKHFFETHVGKLNKKDLESFFNEQFVTDDQKLRDDILQLLNCNLKGSGLYLEGPTGVGKSLLAKFIHQTIYKKHGPFIHLNCSELSEGLLESELFGHKKGAFTGASSDKDGKLKQADGGTLFLDEIGTMSLSMQQKLLTAIEEKAFYPVGSNKKSYSNFTLISATCDDMSELIEKKLFRRDLFYRINDYGLFIPGLKKRPQDIKKLIRFFKNAANRQFVMKEDAIDALVHYHWPGNIRELKSLMTRLSQVPKGIIHKEDLPGKMLFSKNQEDKLLTEEQKDFILKHGFRKFIAKLEKEIILYSYQYCSGKITEIINLLGISNSAFYRMKKYLQ